MKKTNFQQTVKNLFLEFYPKGGPVNNENPDIHEKPHVPKRVDKSECCGAPLSWDFYTAYCTKCGKSTEPAIEEDFPSPYPYNNIHEIYMQFKDIMKEEINEVDFSTKIRGVFYEYASGVANTTPTTEDPVRDPMTDPDGVEQDGEKMKEIGQAVTDLGKKAKEIANKPVTHTIKEYVDTEILPAVLEILKQSENPRATKKELLEFFKLT